MKIVIQFKNIIKNVRITLDHNECFYVKDNTQIVIDELSVHGLHYLTFESDSMHEIDWVSIDGSYLRQCLYLSWGETDQQRIQPCTHFNHNQRLIIPIGYPVSWWIGSAGSQIDDLKYGQDLSKYYQIYWPESIILPENFPPIIRDFYFYNHGFTAIEKNNRNPPYQIIDFNFDGNVIVKEISSTDWLQNNYHNPPSTNYDKAETSNKTAWEKIDIFRKDQGGWLLSDEVLPLTRSFLNNLPVKELLYGFIGRLRPGHYISPHRDKGYSPAHRTESNQGYLYCPLNWPNNNYFKMQNVGLLPIKSGCAIVTNIYDYYHCLVNNSNEDRYIIQTLCRFN